MKPMLFQEQKDLVRMIESMPLPPGNTKHGSSEEIKEQLLSLVPHMFSLRDMLVKGNGGVGNYKSLYRYAEVAADNVSAETVEALKGQLEAIDKEATELLDAGMDEETSSKVSGARGMAAQFTFMRNSILGFKGKIQKVLARVKDKQEALVRNLEENRAKLKKILGNDAAAIERDYQEKVDAIEELSKKLDLYCDLNVSYLSIMMAGSGRESA